MLESLEWIKMQSKSTSNPRLVFPSFAINWKIYTLFGSQTWQWEIPFQWRFEWKKPYKWVDFLACHVWLLKGTGQLRLELFAGSNIGLVFGQLKIQDGWKTATSQAQWRWDTWVMEPPCVCVCWSFARPGSLNALDSSKMSWRLKGHSAVGIPGLSNICHIGTFDLGPTLPECNRPLSKLH